MMQNNEIDIICQQYLNLVYQKMRGHGFTNTSKKNISETYGEILYPSVNVLMSEIELSEQDVFMDLGSGLGKVVLQVFLKSRVRESCGIEIIPALHAQAQVAAEKVQHDLPDFFLEERKLTFLQADFLETSLDKATVVLVGSPCFKPSMIYKLGNVINRTPSIHSVVSLRPISSLNRLRFKKMIRVECSWDTALCYIYK